jgi:hypothetical protein
MPRTSGDRWASATTIRSRRVLAGDHRDDEQIHLVDEVVLEQPADRSAAALHLQLASRLGLQVGDGGREVTGQDGGVRPETLGLLA